MGEISMSGYNEGWVRAISLGYSLKKGREQEYPVVWEWGVDNAKKYGRPTTIKIGDIFKISIRDFPTPPRLRLILEPPLVWNNKKVKVVGFSIYAKNYGYCKEGRPDVTVKFLSKGVPGLDTIDLPPEYLKK
jgi:hypothetical protein